MVDSKNIFDAAFSVFGSNFVEIYVGETFRKQKRLTTFFPARATAHERHAARATACSARDRIHDARFGGLLAMHRAGFLGILELHDKICEIVRSKL